MEGLPLNSLWTAAFIPFFVSFAVTTVLVFFSHKLKIFAPQDKRRQHKNPTPLLGGLGINFGIFTFLFIQAYHGEAAATQISTPIFAAAMFVGMLLGIADDKFEIRSSTKFIGQNLIACLLLFAVSEAETPIHRFLSASPWVVLPIQWFWIMGLLNSMNLIDGLDGLAGGIGLIAISFLSFLSYQQSGELPALGIASMVSIGGFLLWNRHPARIYMGESGSAAIGILIFIASMELPARSATFFTVVAPILAVGIPAFDTLIAIYRRSVRRTSLGTGDRDHLHHRLLRLGISHQSVVRIFYAGTIYLCLLSYQLFPKNEFSPLNATLSVLGMVIIAFMVVLIERKLYTYLRNFGDQMLQVMDAQNYGSVTTFMRMLNLTEQGIPFAAYRINLENCIQTLLISSPGRIHTFYTDLAQYLKENAANREVYFESSTKVLLIHRLDPGSTEKFLRQDVLQVLKDFEAEKSIDLYLSVSNTLQEIDTANEIKNQNENKKRGLFGRRKADRLFRQKS